MIGGTGNDSYFVDSSVDVVTETSTIATEIDSVTATITYTLGANLENLILGGSSLINGTGNTLNNQITGNAANNLLYGLAGNDTLLGGLGDDLLVGGAGNDLLTGGGGIDRFLFDINAIFNATTIGVDRITDFLTNTDKIVLDKTTFTVLRSAAGNGFSTPADFASVADNAAAATSSAYITYSKATGSLFYNQNGTATGLGTGGEFANLSSLPTLTAADFMVQT